MLGVDSPNIRATGNTLSNVESQVFTPYNFWEQPGLNPRPFDYQANVLLFLHYII